MREWRFLQLMSTELGSMGSEIEQVGPAYLRVLTDLFMGMRAFTGISLKGFLN